MGKTTTYHYRGYTGIVTMPRPGIVHCRIPELDRTIASRGDSLALGEELLQLTIDYDCLTWAEVEARDRDADED